MRRFENPDRYICPRENKHAQILAEEVRQRAGRKQGDKNVIRNLGRYGRKGKK